MFEALFGAPMPEPLHIVGALLIVLAGLATAAWAMRRFGIGRLAGAGSRGRQPRLAVIDSVGIEGRRRLILVRRDFVEHLLMIGGPTDVIVESNIVRPGPAPHEVRLERSPAAAIPRPGAIPLPDKPGAIPLPDNRSNSLPPAAPRPARRVQPLPREPVAWPLPPPAERPTGSQGDKLAALADELSTRAPSPHDRPGTPARPHQEKPHRDLRPEPVVEPRHVAPVATETIATAEADMIATAEANLAELAHRLKAVLHQSDAASSPLHAIPLERAEGAAPARQTAANQIDTIYASLEQDLASLLGRPTKH